MDAHNAEQNSATSDKVELLMTVQKARSSPAFVLSCSRRRGRACLTICGCWRTHVIAICNDRQCFTWWSACVLRCIIRSSTEILQGETGIATRNCSIEDGCGRSWCLCNTSPGNLRLNRTPCPLQSFGEG